CQAGIPDAGVRGRVRQGRRGQVVGDRQRRGRAGSTWPIGGRAGRRYLRILGVIGKPTQVEQMIMPPVAYDVKVISIGMFTPGNTAVVWRGPMLHRALQQFLGDVYWGDLDVLLMDLPPGTGDIAISVAQLVPSAELLVVT